LCNKDVETALGLALDLNRPAQMQSIITDYALGAVGKSIAKTEQSGEDRPEEVSEGDVDLQRWVNSLSDDRLEKLIELVERWNTNRKMASLAQMLMGLILNAMPPSKLAKLEGMNATCSTILSYSGRHMARVESLLQKTFLFDLVLQSSSQGLALQDEMDLAGKGSSSAKKPSAASAETALSRTMAVLLGPVKTDAGSDEHMIRAEQSGAVRSGKVQQVQRSNGSTRKLLLVEESDEELCTGTDPVANSSAPNGSAGEGKKRLRKKRRKDDT